ncbi:MAG: phosphonate ABC transporter ATP-binding protein [bacterium]
MKNDNILKVIDLHKTYSNGIHALKGISFEVKKGEFLAIIGLSGSGKSTLLRCLNRIHEPTEGKIIFDDKEITQFKGQALRKVRREMGMIFQDFNLIERYSVMTNVLMGYLGFTQSFKSILGMWTPEVKKRVIEKLKIFGLDDKINDRVDSLSGGQQQRVAIARALMQEPKLLLADEPVASLDPATSINILEYIGKINREYGITVICNIHSLDLVKSYASRMIALRKGRIIFEGQSPLEVDKKWFEAIYGDSG